MPTDTCGLALAALLLQSPAIKKRAKAIDDRAMLRDSISGENQPDVEQLIFKI